MFQTLSQYIASLRAADQAGTKDRKIQELVAYYDKYCRSGLLKDAPIGVIYARYSSHNQRVESIEDQVMDCLVSAAAEGIKIVAVYFDKAVTGRTDLRAGFQEMMRDAGKGKWAVLVVWKNDRIGRNRYELATNKMKLKKQGIRVLYAREHVPEGPEGIILESVLEGMAEYYSANLSENVKRGCHGNALEAKSNGARPPLGLMLDGNRQYTPNPQTAPIVELIFTMYNEGHSFAEIQSHLNERGYRTSMGNSFGKNSIAQILHNPAYIGTYKYSDVVIENAFPAVIGPELWAAVQEKLGRRSKLYGKKKEAADFILTTKIFCGGCGSAFLGESGTGRSGKVYHYYKCIDRKHGKAGKGCSMRTVRKEWIEDLVISETRKLLQDDDNLAYLVEVVLRAQEQDADTSRLDSLKVELAEVERELKNLLHAIEQGIITETTKGRMFELEDQKARISTGIMEESMRRPMLNAEEVLFFLERWRDGNAEDPAYRQNLIDALVNAVYVYQDKIVIVYNFFDDGGDRVKLHEVETYLQDDSSPAQAEGSNGDPQGQPLS